jgi:hypothetical protein
VEDPETEHELAPTPHFIQEPFEAKPYPDKHSTAPVLFLQAFAPVPQASQVLLE